MRLVGLLENGKRIPGLLVDETHFVDLSSIEREMDDGLLGGIVSGGLLRELAASDLPRRALADIRLAAPIPRPGKIVCIGLNYADHAQESGMPVPEEPIVFFKASSTLVGPHGDVRIPRNSTKTDWEVELGVVIGAECRYLESPKVASSRIAGFVVSHDVSEREFQLERGGQWVKGKSCETFNPCGPWLVTPDEIEDVQNLAMWLDVNGERKQTGSTATMIFDVPFLVWYLSQFMVLEPGDLINTGTPPGVGMGMSPQQFLKAGDVVELGIEQLGTQRQRFVVAP
jgi:2-keto-4-pentenoate hydratase/2-oxohepta-3-ene-1,7-dioic acid hydratase in catechol pathway